MILQLFFSGEACDYTDADTANDCDPTAHLVCVANVCSECANGGTYDGVPTADPGPTCTGCNAGFGGLDCATAQPVAGRLFFIRDWDLT